MPDLISIEIPMTEIASHNSELSMRNMILTRLKDAGAPVTGAALLTLTSGVLTSVVLDESGSLQFNWRP